MFAERVKSGELLSDAFAAQSVFPRIYTTTLMAGEKSGNTEKCWAATLPSSGWR